MVSPNLLMSRWENGKLEARKSSNGEVIAKDNFQDGIAAVLKADLRLDGRMQVLGCIS